VQQDRTASGNSFFDNKETDQHARAIERLARELALSPDEVKRSYTEILAALRKEAKIMAFLPVLVSRSVKERLRQK
jgi:Protein of unknown function (DUF3562)